MKVCFIGLGSIAVRHIKNLKEILGGELSVSVLRSGKGKGITGETEALIDHICYHDSELEQRYDAVFITNPTNLHYTTLLKYKYLSKYFFIEKPVFETGEETLYPFHDDGNIYYTACPLRYTNVIQYLKKNIDFSSIYSIRSISSSYLPEWRIGTDYRDSYSAHKDMGGGVSIDLIHEWDYLSYLIGKPEEVMSIIRKKSDLEIDSDDIAVYIAEYVDKVVELHLDYFGRSPLRKIELYGREDTILGDLIHEKIKWMRSGKEIDLKEERDDYQKQELMHFLNIIDGKADNDNDIAHACDILRIARGEVLEK